jgi:hypothetical protein
VTREEVQEFIDQVRKGTLAQFERYVHSFRFNALQLADIANVASKRISIPEVWIPHVSRIASSYQGKPCDLVRLHFRVNSVRRILIVSTDPEERSLVAGPPKDEPDRLPVALHEDPYLLFRQVAALFSLPRIPAPPPMTACSSGPRFPVPLRSGSVSGYKDSKEPWRPVP